MTKGELVERLKPLHVVDQPLIAVADVLIAEKRPGVAAVVDAWILENNALKSEAATALSEQAARIEELERALTPSADTKAAYEGDFYMSVVLRTRHEEEVRSVQVPWATIKEIMAAIRRRARTTEKKDG